MMNGRGPAVLGTYSVSCSLLKWQTADISCEKPVFPPYLGVGLSMFVFCSVEDGWDPFVTQIQNVLERYCPC
jgi:hypothetical protein